VALLAAEAAVAARVEGGRGAGLAASMPSEEKDATTTTKTSTSTSTTTSIMSSLTSRVDDLLQEWEAEDEGKATEKQRRIEHLSQEIGLARAEQARVEAVVNE
jgi:hypothetical protein